MLDLAATTTADLAGLVGALGRLAEAVDDPERVDRIRLLEEIQSAAVAAQMGETAAFVASQRAAQREAGVGAERVGKGTAAQIALAKRMAPHRASRFVQAATILTRELPGTFEQLRIGRTTEWRATIVARETAWLSLDHRREVDRRLAPELERLGDRATEQRAKALAYRLDPHGYVDRVKLAENERRVSLRPAPEAMARLTTLLPMTQGVSTYATLGRDADSLIAAGDGRSRGQLMADLLVERVTGRATASEGPVEIGLIMTERTLLRGGDDPAVLEGYGPIPARTARDLVTELADDVPVRLRQLYADPTSSQLVAMSSRARNFPPALRRFVRYRDQYCRTPWCGAPIRHTDHVRPAARRGSTGTDNGQGLCVACNQAKEAPGWRTRSVPSAARHELELRTPTGHRYRSRAPDPPGGPTPVRAIELWWQPRTPAA